MRQTNSGTNGTNATQPTPAAERLAGLVIKCPECGLKFDPAGIRRNPAASENELATAIAAAPEFTPDAVPQAAMDSIKAMGAEQDRRNILASHGRIRAADDVVDPHAAPVEEPDPFCEATGPMVAPTGTGALARGTDAPAVLVELARLCLVRHEQYRNIPKWMSEPEPDATDAEWTAYAKWKREDKQREEERLGTLGQIRDYINANRAAIEDAIGTGVANV